MAMQRIEDMNETDLNCLVSVLLEPDPKAVQESEESFFSFDDFVRKHQGGFHRGELNMICCGKTGGVK